VLTNLNETERGKKRIKYNRKMKMGEEKRERERNGNCKFSLLAFPLTPSSLISYCNLNLKGSFG